jgi:hypothetical protein
VQYRSHVYLIVELCAERLLRAWEWWEGGNWDGQAKKKEASLDADELILLKNAFMMGGDQDGGVWGTLLLNYNSNQVPTWLSKDFEVPEQPEA